MPRILFVDDEPSILEGLRDTLRGEPFELLTATSGAEALAMMGQGSIDVLVTDDEMPGMRGVDLVSEVHRRHPDVVKLMLTGKARLDSAITAINEAQIFRFLTKPCASETLRAALRVALTQRALAAVSNRILEFSRGAPPAPVASSSLAPAPSSGSAEPAHGPIEAKSDPLSRLPERDREALSPREREILRAVLSGKGTKDVARAFFISIHTARNHLKTIYRKLDVHSRTELMGKVLAAAPAQA
jgi:DNA-binding NarL/FixJ family response regulator